MKLINNRFKIVGEAEQILNHETYIVEDINDNNKAKRLTFYKLPKHKKTVEYLINYFLEIANIDHKLLLKSEHFHIVESINSNKQNAPLYILIHEIKNGQLLHSSKKNFTDKEKLTIILELMHLIDHLHFRGVVYKYLSPDNIFIDENNEIKVRDLGFVCEENIQIGCQNITEYFISPEIYDSFDGIDEKSDYFSLGVMIKYLFLKDYKTQNISINDFVETTKIDKKQKDFLIKTVKNLTQRYPFNRDTDLRTHMKNIIKEFKLDYKYNLIEERNKINIQVKIQGRDEEINKILENDELLDTGNRMYDSVLITGQKGTGKTRILRELDFKLRMKSRQIINISMGLNDKTDNDNISKLLTKSIPLASSELINKYKMELNEYLPTNTDIKKTITKSLNYKSRHRFYNRITNYFIELANNENLYILIDDIHDCDQEFLSLLKHLMINLKDRRVMFISTCLELSMTVDSIMKNQLIEWSTNDLILKITLKELGKEEFKKIMKAKFGYSENHQNLIAFLYDITEGNLLKLYYIISELYDKGDIYMNESGNWNTNVEDYEDIFVYLDIHHILKKQIIGISNEAYDFIKLSSIFEKHILEEHIIEIMNLDDIGKERILDELLECKIIEKTENNTRNLYSFYNIELKRLLYHELEKTNKISIHRNLADSLLKIDYLKDRSILEELVFQLKKSNREELGLDIILKKAMEKDNKFSDDSLYLLELAYSLIQNDPDYQSRYKTLHILKNLIDIYDLKDGNRDIYNYIEELNKISIIQNNNYYLLKSKYYKAEYYILRNKLDDANLFIKEIYILANKLDIYEGKMMALYLQSKLNFIENDWKQLIENSDQLILTSKMHRSEKYLGDIYNILALYNYFNGNVIEAVNNFNQSIEFFYKNKNIVKTIEPINNLGKIYLDYYGNENKALTFYKKGYKLSQKYNVISGISDYSFNIGVNCLEKLELDKALKLLKHSNKLYISRSDFKGIFLSNLKLATVYLKKEDVVNLYNAYLNIRDTYKKNSKMDIEIRSSYYNFLAQMYGKFGEWNRALENTVLAKELYRKFNVKEYHKFVLMEVYFIYRINGKIKKEHKELIYKIVENYSSINISNDFLMIILRICQVSLIHKDKEFTKEMILVYEKLKADNELGSLEILKKSIINNINLDIDVLKQIDYIELKNHAPTIRFYVHMNVGLSLLENQEYKRSIYHLLKSLGVILETIEYIEDYKLKIGFIKSSNGDLIKQNICDAINLEFDKDVKCLMLDRIDPENIYDYFNINFITNTLSNEELNSIFYIYNGENKIDSIETLLYSMTNNYKYNLDNILNYIGAETLAENGFIFIHDESINEYRILSSFESKDSEEFNLNKLAYLDKEKNGVFINKNSFDKEDRMGFLSKENMAIMGIPIGLDKFNSLIVENRKAEQAIDEEYKGFIYLESRDYINRFNWKNFEKLKSISKLIYLNIENHILKTISNTDKLTNTMTRKYFDSSLEKYTDGYYGERLEFTMLMLDIDDFKDINDTYGHLKGDTALKQIGFELKNSIRTEDLVCRYGGDEFVIALLNTNIDEGYKVAEKIRKKIEDTKIRGIDMGVSITIGVSHFPTHGHHKKDLMEKCDEALYFAKEELGKNSVAIWDDSFQKNRDDHSQDENSINLIFNIDDEVASSVSKTTNLIRENLNLKEKSNMFLEILIDSLKAEEAHLVFVEGSKINSSIFVNRDPNHNSKTSKYKLNIIYKALSYRKAEFFIDWESYDTIDSSSGTPDWKSIIYMPLIKNGDIKAIIYTSVSINEKEFNINDFNLVKLLSNIFLANF